MHICKKNKLAVGETNFKHVHALLFSKLNNTPFILLDSYILHTYAKRVQKIRKLQYYRKNKKFQEPFF